MIAIHAHIYSTTPPPESFWFMSFLWLPNIDSLLSRLCEITFRSGMQPKIYERKWNFNHIFWLDKRTHTPHINSLYELLEWCVEWWRKICRIIDNLSFFYMHPYFERATDHWRWRRQRTTERIKWRKIAFCHFHSSLCLPSIYFETTRQKNVQQTYIRI